MTKSKRVVLLIDMQEFFLKNFRTQVRNELISNQEILIEACLQKHIPFVVVEYKCRGIFRGHTISRLLNKVARLSVTTIDKSSNSAFTKTELDETLKELGAQEIILMGINANGCIQDTAMSALKRGYRVTTSKGIIASSSRLDANLSDKNEKWYRCHVRLFATAKDIVSYIKQ